MRILALVPGGIGDQLLFFPTLETLKTQYPNATIDVVVEPRSKSAYSISPFTNEVLLLDFRDRNGLADYLNLLGVIRDREYEVSINLSTNWIVALLLWLNGIPTRGGYEGTNSTFVNQTIPLKSEQYQAYQYHDLTGLLGIQLPCPPPQVSLPKSAIDWAEAEQKRLDIKNSGYILLYDYASYPINYWRDIIDDIQQKQPNIPIVLLETLESEAWIVQLQANRPNLKIVQPIDIAKLAAIIAGANLLITPEGDVLQTSVAVGTFTYGLFAKSLAKNRLPPGQQAFLGIQSPTDKIEDIAPNLILEKLWQA